MKYFSTMIAAVLLAAVAALGVHAFDPAPAEAADDYAASKCGGGKISLNADEFRSWQLHNDTRKSRGLSRLCVHPALQKAARAHSQDMLDRDYFDHYTKGTGRDPGQRIKSAGYDWRTYGENIGFNQTTPEAMHDAWMHSSGHRHNILNGRFREVGIGAVTGDYNGSRGDYNGSRVTMYTVDFGAR